MKIAVNKSYGQFGLSPLGMKNYYNKKGKKCYFFDMIEKIKTDKFIELTLDEANEKRSLFYCFSIKNPNCKNFNFEKHFLDPAPEDRGDFDLIETIEELQEKANASYSKLKIIEVLDGIEYVIKGHDGIEHVAEIHRAWH